MNARTSFVSIQSFMLLLSVSLSGCGSSDSLPLSSVSGQVTLDGEPLAGAQVVFQPADEQGTYSTARTDQRGHYTLRYSRRQQGALQGLHKVSISTEVRDAEDENGNSTTIPERVPAQYNRKSNLVKQVDSGYNKIDLQLSSQDTLTGSSKTRR